MAKVAAVGGSGLSGGAVGGHFEGQMSLVRAAAKGSTEETLTAPGLL